MDLFFTLALHQELANAAALVVRAQIELTENIDAAAKSKPVGRVKASPRLETLCAQLEDSARLIRGHVERWAAAEVAAAAAADTGAVDTDPTMDT